MASAGRSFVAWDTMGLATEEVTLAAAGVEVAADLAVPDDAAGLVVFAHGSGSSRRSPRNRFVAEALHERHLATLLIDLLSREEAADPRREREMTFDVPTLGRRVVDSMAWAAEDPRTAGLAVGLFGASTGAGAALVAAAVDDEGVRVVVSRGGRPDLAGDALARVTCPVLLVVGGLDTTVLGLNEEALDRLGSVEKRLEVVPGASHLFEEPGTLEAVVEPAGRWFGRHLVGHE